MVPIKKVVLRVSSIAFIVILVIPFLPNSNSFNSSNPPKDIGKYNPAKLLAENKYGVSEPNALTVSTSELFPSTQDLALPFHAIEMNNYTAIVVDQYILKRMKDNTFYEQNEYLAYEIPSYFSERQNDGFLQYESRNYQGPDSHLGSKYSADIQILKFDSQKNAAKYFSSILAKENKNIEFLESSQTKSSTLIDSDGLACVTYKHDGLISQVKVDEYYCHIANVYYHTSLAYLRIESKYDDQVFQPASEQEISLLLTIPEIIQKYIENNLPHQKIFH